MKRLKIILQSKSFFLLSLVFILVYIVIFTKVIPYSSNYDINDSEFTGKIVDFKIDGDKFSFILKAKEKLQCSYYFKNLEDKNFFIANISLGQELKIKGNLSLPLNNTIPNTFNYKKYLNNKKIYWLLNVKDMLIIKKQPSFPYNIKNVFISRVNKFDFIMPYMRAFILGDSGYIDSDVYDNFQNNGVTHLFAVSGMHIGLFILVIDKLLKRIHFKENTISYLTICFFLFYIFLVGFTASVVRATMFYILLFINKKFNWNFKSMYLFYFLFLLLLLINPFYIYDVGFIYSFTTSFGLMLFSKKITGNYFIKLLKTSSIAFIFSLPITIYFNYEFNMMSILNNFIVVPIVSLVLFPLSLLTFLFPFLSNVLSIGFSLLEIINKFLKYISINVVVGKVSVIFIVLYYLIVFLGHKRIYFYSLIILLLFVYKYKTYLDNNFYIYYLDVGQGDATLIVAPYKKDIILIDSGGKIEFEKENWKIRNSNFNLADTLVKFMKSLGVSKIDLFIATHGDKDHIGYSLDLFKIIKCNKLMFNNNAYNSDEKKLLKLIPELIKNEYYGSNISVKNLNTNVSSDENDSSLVLYMSILNNNFLFMGDTPKSVELDIIKKYNLNIDVLKVGHHGSNTSSDLYFLKIIKPNIAIISSGRNNRYNHPSTETIQSLEKLRISYFNTQNKGTIGLIINNKKKKIIFYEP